MHSHYWTLSTQLSDLSSQMSRIERIITNELNPNATNSLHSDDYALVKKSNTSASRDNSSNMVSARVQSNLDPNVALLSGDGLRFQLTLNSLGDLLNLLSAQYASDSSLPNEFPFLTQISSANEDFPRSNRCTLFRIREFPQPFKNNDLMLPVRPLPLHCQFADQLFHIYTSECFFPLHHPECTEFLEEYYRDKLDPSLVNTAIAFSAAHLVLAHKQTPMTKSLYSMVGGLLSQARSSLESVFDTPTPQAVLAFLNMASCMRVFGRIEDTYTYYKQAALMALALKMDKENPHEINPTQREFQVRIWCTVCKYELWFVYVGGKSVTIDLNVIRNSPKPTLRETDGEKYKNFLLLFQMDLALCDKMSKIAEIDWSLSDDAIMLDLFVLSAFLQQEHRKIMQQYPSIGFRGSLTFEIGSDFWLYWCNLWQQFIVSNAPAKRLDTELMQQLQRKAYEEYTKGLFNLIRILQEAIRNQSWCEYSPFIHTHEICKLKTLRLLRTMTATSGVVEQWLSYELMETLKEIKP
ncbi:uncharacterized protein VTP21DRAFT_6164 [Calcarisporiella thermophila]|uniref:uncharacterized protein n=1 Tax=Calcarisporiella thermophila TaxID=911321 RepID=UPI003742454D